MILSPTISYNWVRQLNILPSCLGFYAKKIHICFFTPFLYYKNERVDIENYEKLSSI